MLYKGIEGMILHWKPDSLERLASISLSKLEAHLSTLSPQELSTPYDQSSSIILVLSNSLMEHHAIHNLECSMTGQC